MVAFIDQEATEKAAEIEAKVKKRLLSLKIKTGLT